MKQKIIKSILTGFSLVLFFFCWFIVFGYKVIISTMTPQMFFILWVGSTIIALVSMFGYILLFFYRAFSFGGDK